MTLSFSQTSIDYNTSTFDDQNDIIISTDELVFNDTFSTLPNYNSCYPNCHLLVRPNHLDASYIIELICSIVAIISIIIVLILIFLRHSKKQQKKEKHCLQIEKTYAHPFEEILMVDDEPQSIQLVQVEPTTHAN